MVSQSQTPYNSRMKNPAHFIPFFLFIFLAGNPLFVRADAPLLETGNPRYLNPSDQKTGSSFRVHDTQSPTVTPEDPLLEQKLSKLIDTFKETPLSSSSWHKTRDDLLEELQRATGCLQENQRKRLSQQLLSLMNSDQEENLRGTAAEAIGRLGFLPHHKTLMIAFPKTYDFRIQAGILKGLVAYLKAPTTPLSDKKRISDYLFAVFDDNDGVLIPLFADLMESPHVPPGTKSDIVELLGEAPRGNERYQRGLLDRARVVVASGEESRIRQLMGTATTLAGQKGAENQRANLSQMMRETARVLEEKNHPLANDVAFAVIEFVARSPWNREMSTDSWMATNILSHAGKAGEPYLVRELNLENLDPRLRERVLREFDVPSETALSVLRYALGDSSLEVRIAAMETLARHKTLEAANLLAEALGTQEDPRIRMIAVKALKEFPDPSVLPAIREIVKKTNYKDYVAFDAVEVIEHFKTEAAPVLLDWLKNCPDTRVQGNVIFSLGVIRDARAVNALLPYLESSGTNRIYARQSLAQIGKPAIPGLLNVLQTGSTPARMEAAYALGEVPAASESVLKLLQEGKPEEQRWASLAIGEKDVPEAIPFLKQILQEKEASLREHAVWRLGWIRHPDSIAALKSMLKDPELNVRGSARYALKKLGEKVEDIP